MKESTQDLISFIVDRNGTVTKLTHIILILGYNFSVNTSSIVSHSYSLFKNCNVIQSGSTIYDEKCSKIPLPSTASCAKKPAAASIARRPFCNSFVIIMFNSSGSSGFKPRGSNPMSPG